MAGDAIDRGIPLPALLISAQLEQVDMALKLPREAATPTSLILDPPRRPHELTLMSYRKREGEQKLLCLPAEAVPWYK